MQEQLSIGKETMSTHPYNEILAKIQQLPLKEQLKIVEAIISSLQQKVVEPLPQVAAEETLHSIMEFEGLGKEVWEGVNVDEYLNEERNSWSC